MKPELTEAISVYMNDVADKFAAFDFCDAYDKINDKVKLIRAARFHIFSLEVSIKDIKKILS